MILTLKAPGISFKRNMDFKNFDNLNFESNSFLVLLRLKAKFKLIKLLFLFKEGFYLRKNTVTKNCEIMRHHLEIVRIFVLKKLLN